ncbi:uncharacterized protein LOC105192343 [Harpegnathos saltator]|uniref:uncharacterized protein LOC105192343 n=1 Tax=Harpegnathos saltator TaxID=610380 RepID=UPI0009489410|nr:uncharacterized protein LOC105192343 [Harpegnathos saltator]
MRPNVTLGACDHRNDNVTSSGSMLKFESYIAKVVAVSASSEATPGDMIRVKLFREFFGSRRNLQLHREVRSQFRIFYSRKYALVDFAILQYLRYLILHTYRMLRSVYTLFVEIPSFIIVIMNDLCSY